MAAVGARAGSVRRINDSCASCSETVVRPSSGALMRIGIAFTLKPDEPPPAGPPDDLHEEYDSPKTVQAIADVFRSLGHTVRELGDGRAFLEAVLRVPPDL